MKRFYKIATIIFNICIILASGITAALTLAASRGYYEWQFEKNGIYSTPGEEGEVRRRIYYVGGDATVSATFSDAQYDLMIDHIKDYLFGDKESFELTLDGVYVWGVGLCDGVSVFGESAISHMADVKGLMKTAAVIGAASAVISTALLVLFIIKRRECSEFFLRFTGYFYAAAAIFAVGFSAFSLIGSLVTKLPFLYMLWGNLHYLLFPFQPEKYANSYLADPITQILTLEFFITALVIVLLALALTVVLWIATAYLIKRRVKKESA